MTISSEGYDDLIIEVTPAGYSDPPTFKIKK